MKKWHCSLAVLGLALAGSLTALAQTMAGSPPNILNIETINIKPYADSLYDKVASEYPALSKQLKDPTHLLAMEALSGSPRAIYLSGFDSLEALQKNEEWLPGDAATDGKLEALDARQAASISEVHHAIWHYRADLSNNAAGADIPHSHYWEVMIYHMKAGHADQFEEFTKLYRDANVKIGQNTPWTVYEGLRGVTNAYLILVPMKSLKEQDASLEHRKDLAAALGDTGKTRMNKISEESVASEEDDIFMVNPEWSYVEKSWVDADPHYWAPSDPGPKRAAKSAGGGGASAGKTAPEH